MQKENWFPRLSKGFIPFSTASVLLILALIYIGNLSTNTEFGLINPANLCRIPANTNKGRQGFVFDVLRTNQKIAVAYVIDRRAEIIYLDPVDFSISKRQEIPIDYASDISLDETGNIYVLGRNSGSETGLYLFDSTTMNHHILFKWADMMNNSAEVDIQQNGNYLIIRQNNNLNILHRDRIYASSPQLDQNKLNKPETFTGKYSWHPNKGLITVEIFHNSQFNLYDYDLSNSEETLFMPTGIGKSCQFSPSWSNSGTLAFESIEIEQDSTTDIYILTQQNRLSNLTPTTGFYERQPTWSPDSKVIAYTRSDSSMLASHDIFILSIGSTTPQQLTKTPNIDESYPIFISNKVLLFSSFDIDLSATTLELIDVSQKTPQRVLSIPVDQ